MNNDDLNVPKGQKTPEELMAEEALERVAAQQRARQELPDMSSVQAQQDALEMLDVPDDLEEEGQHTLNDMGLLARVGKSTHDFELYGNKIVLRTLTVGEELDILQKCQRFKGQPAQSKAYTVYVTANAIESVNGAPYFERLPLGPKDDMQTYKFQEFLVMDSVVVNTMINEYSKLRSKVEKEARYAKK